MLGGALMAVGGAFLTLAVLGTFTLDIIAGRGWVCIALVIFGRWRIWRGVAGALIFVAVFSLGLRLRILAGLASVPPELMLALPYLAVIARAGASPAATSPIRAPTSSRTAEPDGRGPMEIDDRDRAASWRSPSSRRRIGPIRGRRAGRRRAGRRRARCWRRATTGASSRAAPIRHGETDALENAGRLPASVYRRATMYTTLSPCDMCTGAILLYGSRAWSWARTATFVGGEDYLRARGVEVVNLDSTGVQAADATSSSPRHPEIWNEDIGEE